MKKLTAVANEAKENLKSVKGEVQSLESDIHKRYSNLTVLSDNHSTSKRLLKCHFSL